MLFFVFGLHVSLLLHLIFHVFHACFSHVIFFLLIFLYCYRIWTGCFLPVLFIVYLITCVVYLSATCKSWVKTEMFVLPFLVCEPSNGSVFQFLAWKHPWKDDYLPVWKITFSEIVSQDYLGSGKMRKIYPSVTESLIYAVLCIWQDIYYAFGMTSRYKVESNWAIIDSSKAYTQISKEYEKIICWHLLVIAWNLLGLQIKILLTIKILKVGL